MIRRHVPDPAYRVVLFGSRSAGERSDIEIGIDGPTPVSRAALAALPRSADFWVALANGIFYLPVSTSLARWVRRWPQG